jgi:hypothetical protein
MAAAQCYTFGNWDTESKMYQVPQLYMLHLELISVRRRFAVRNITDS